jgi:hypothetical protein
MLIYKTGQGSTVCLYTRHDREGRVHVSRADDDVEVWDGLAAS